MEHWVQRRGASVREAVFPVGATDDEVVGAYVAVCSARTMLAAAMVAAVVDPPVLVDAAHVSGSPPTEVAGLGATWWVGNLYKWAYTPVPRGAVLLWRSGAVE